MTLLLLAALLPGVYWDAGPATADALREAAIHAIVVPRANADAWRGVPGVSITTEDPAARVQLASPGVNYRINEASATQAPWVDANGWRFMRTASGRFFCDAPGGASAIAAAEAYAYSADVLIHTDAEGLKPLGRMLSFLDGLPRAGVEPLASIGFIDDGSAAASEWMNLLVRRNLLFRIVPEHDRHYRFLVKSSTQAQDPNLAVQEIRGRLTDAKRLLRVYGSEVVIARLTGPPRHVRVHLLNYAAARRDVAGVRVRILGRYPHHQAAVEGLQDAKLLDYSLDRRSTEFTIESLPSYAVIDLWR